ncbi:MAG: hypothetical protein J7M05_14500 [Anaerolineae bacterium]|nr:hypothetical protein [Anaerolineae bacterium]
MGYDWYRKRVYKLEDMGRDPSDRLAALERAWEYPGGGRIPTGIFYRTEEVPAYEEQLPALRAGPLPSQPLHVRPVEEYRQLVEEFI